MVLQRAVIRWLPLEVLLVSSLAMAGAIIRVAPALAGAGDLAAAAAVPAPASAPAGLSPVFSAEVQRWAPSIAEWSGRFGLEPNLVATVMQIESCGWAQAVSGSGAQGLFQVMPFHFDDGEDMLNPDTNAGRGLAYLALGLQRANGDVSRALAGYNGGHSQIGKDPALWPAETQRYVYWGTGIYADASSGQAASVRLLEWLANGGASLCRRAAEAPSS